MNRVYTIAFAVSGLLAIGGVASFLLVGEPTASLFEERRASIPGELRGEAVYSPREVAVRAVDGGVLAEAGTGQRELVRGESAEVEPASMQRGSGAVGLGWGISENQAMPDTQQEGIAERSQNQAHAAASHPGAGRSLQLPGESLTASSVHGEPPVDTKHPPGEDSAERPGRNVHGTKEAAAPDATQPAEGTNAALSERAQTVSDTGRTAVSPALAATEAETEQQSGIAPPRRIRGMRKLFTPDEERYRQKLGVQAYINLQYEMATGQKRE